MKFQKLFVSMSTVFAIIAFSGGIARASRIPRVELLREVSITGTRIMLSDLLPANASASLRATAAQISMGAAPQPGSTRILERDAVERRAGSSEKMLAEVSVPEHIVVSHNSRPITLTEVFETIRNALKQGGMPAAATLQLADVLLESQVFVGPGEPGLRVMRMDRDRELGRVRFLLWPSRSPKVLPFFVTVQLTGELLRGELPLNPNRSSKMFGRSAQAPVVTQAVAHPVKQEILVGTGERATLALHSNTLRIFVDVVSLERGALGQMIRVRMPETGKIFSAQVDGRNHLEVKF